MKFRYLPLLFIVTFVVMIVLTGLTGAQANAEDIDTGDSFQPSSMCPTPEPQVTNTKPWPALRQGHYGMRVELLQATLGIRADGCFGAGTHRTVIRYQTCKGLVVDGIAGNQTWTALQRDPSISNCKASVTQTVSNVPEGCNHLTCVVVLRNTRQVIVYDGSGKLIAQGPIIYNRDKLVKGTFSVTEKKSVNYSEDLEWKLNRFVRFSGHFGFHEIPISVDTGERMHGEELLGTGSRQSGGCIRTSRSFQEILWYNTVVGTPVIVI